MKETGGTGLPFDAAALLAAAMGARDNAYAPYSRFAVGAAALAADGRVFTGCNVENAAYPSGCCAERVALYKGVSEGVRAGDFVALALAGGQSAPAAVLADFSPPEAGVMPCGQCRQVMAELGGPGLWVVTLGEGGESTEGAFVNGNAVGVDCEPRARKLEELLPCAFG